MSAATAHVVTLTSTDEVDSGAVGEAVTAISSGLPEVAKDVRMIAALMDDSGETLIDATRKLCNAFSDLLTAAEPDTQEVAKLFVNWNTDQRFQFRQCENFSKKYFASK